MDQVREGGRTVLVLDSGNLFFNQLQIPKDMEDQLRRKAGVMTDGYMKIGTDAVNIGPFDLVLGVEFLLDKSKTRGLPLISSNIVDKDGNHPFKEYIVKETEGKRIGIIGLSKQPDFEINGISFAPPTDTAKKMVGRLRKTVDLLVLLSNLGNRENERIAREVPGIGIIVSGGDRTSLFQPLTVGETLIVQAGAEGKQIGKLEIPEIKTLPKGASNSISIMDDKVNKKGEIEEIIQSYKKALSKAPIKQRPVQAVPPDVNRYIGEAACSKCHERQKEFWAGTRHATAFASLVKGNSHRDLECVGCHTTGFRMPGGYSEGLKTPDLTGVQCESCHGPGGRHRGRGDIIVPTDASVCINCHTVERAPHFRAYSAFIKVRCPKGKMTAL